MPAVSSSNQDRIDVRACQDVTEISVRGTIGVAVVCVDKALSLVASVGSDITNGDNLYIIMSHEVLHIARSLAAQTDSSHNDPATGWYTFGTGQDG